MSKQQKYPQPQPALAKQQQPPPLPKAQPEFESDGTDTGFVLERSKNRGLWRLTHISRGPDGQLATRTVGVLPRSKFLVEIVRKLDEIKRYVYEGTGL
jgi:hypothetical protein